MYPRLVLLLLLVLGLLCFLGYCAALIDWLTDFQAGIYAQNHLEAFLETSLLVIYTALALHFARSKLMQ